MWATSPKKIYKWIRGTAAVWDIAILSEDGFALSPDQAAQAELQAWSKLWQPGRTHLSEQDLLDVLLEYRRPSEHYCSLSLGQSQRSGSVEHSRTSSPTRHRHRGSYPFS
eukprot:4575387-Amphidinium_carterae.1